MRTALLILLLISLGNPSFTQELGLSLSVKTSKYKEIGGSLGYSLGYFKHFKGNGRAGINLSHAMGKTPYQRYGFDTNQGQLSTFIWDGDISHHNLIMQLHLDLDITKSSKSNLYMGIHTSFGYSFLKYKGSNHYLNDDLIIEQETKNKSVFLFPNIGVTFEYELVIHQQAFALFLEPAFALLNNDDLHHSENNVLESISAGLAYRFKFQSAKL